MTEQERRHLHGLLKIGSGSLVAIDKALPAASQRDQRSLITDRAKIELEVALLEAVLDGR